MDSKFKSAKLLRAHICTFKMDENCTKTMISENIVCVLKINSSKCI